MTNGRCGRGWLARLDRERFALGTRFECAVGRTDRQNESSHQQPKQMDARLIRDGALLPELDDVIFRFTPFDSEVQPHLHGVCSLELTGYDLTQVPLACCLQTVRSV